MTMNFWEAQRKARSRTTWFMILFLFLTAVVAVVVEISVRFFIPDYDETTIPWVGIIFALITFGVAMYQYSNFKTQGGGYVAESLGARQVDPNTATLKEKQLLNIVHEMAVAASLPMPPVFILPAKQINAFAAGLNPQDAVVTVTEGSLQKLSRDELQGVIGHELGHVYNGDMKISMRLAAMVMGFFFVLSIGLQLMRFTSFRQSENGNDSKRGFNPLTVLSLVFMAAGAFTWLFGSILKSAVSREREYLADACAVQFTRNPNGIANALRKIEDDEKSDMPSQGAPFSHLYFNDLSALSFLFATHPPIEDRIAAILGGRYDFDKKDQE